MNASPPQWNTPTKSIEASLIAISLQSMIPVSVRLTGSHNTCSAARSRWTTTSVDDAAADIGGPSIKCDLGNLRRVQLIALQQRSVLAIYNVVGLLHAAGS